MRLSLTNPCMKHTRRLATLEGWRKRLRAMRGWLATLNSMKTKKTAMTAPKTIRQITVGEFQGNVTPPKLSPSSSIRVRPRMNKLPSQSMAPRPSTTLVLGLCTSRNTTRSMKAVPDMGRLTQKFQRHDRYCEKTPPRIGPTTQQKPRQTPLGPDKDCDS